MNTQYDDILNKIVSEWTIVEKNKHHIESKSGITIVNVKYIENLRHSFSHFIIGVKSQLQNKPIDETTDQYKTALNHLRNLDVNGYEYLAGVLLKRLKSQIEASGYFVNIGKANNLFDEASNKFGMGRSSRTENKKKAMDCFESCIDLCQKGLLSIVPATKAEKVRINLAIASIIIALIALAISIFK